MKKKEGRKQFPILCGNGKRVFRRRARCSGNGRRVRAGKSGGGGYGQIYNGRFPVFGGKRRKRESKSKYARVYRREPERGVGAIEKRETGLL